MRILCVFETDVIVVQKCVFALQNVENRFYTIYLHDLLHGVTRGYRELQGIQGITGGYNGLQGITRGYRGLQRVTGGYNQLQGVTRGCKGLQEVTKGYRGLQGITQNFFLATTSLDTFSSPILHENQSRRNLQFLTTTMD